MKNFLTLIELQKRQSLTLSQKIDHSLGVIDSFLSTFPNMKVSFSGGVDSTVMLYLTRIIDKNRKAIFVNTTNEHSEIIKFVKSVENVETISPEINFSQVVEKYGFPLISKAVGSMLWKLRHPTEKNMNTRNLYLTGYTKDGVYQEKFKLAEKYKYLIDVDFDISDRCCDYLKKAPFAKISKEGNLVGTLAIDSRLRTFNYLKTGCINISKKQATPLSIWTKQDIWKFIKQQNIPYCNVYDKGETHTGCAYCGFGIQFDRARFARLREREPKRWKIMMNLKNNGVTYREAIQQVIKIDVENYQKSFDFLFKSH